MSTEPSPFPWSMVVGQNGMEIRDRHGGLVARVHTSNLHYGTQTANAMFIVAAHPMQTVMEKQIEEMRSILTDCVEALNVATTPMPEDRQTVILALRRAQAFLWPQPAPKEET